MTDEEYRKLLAAAKRVSEAHEEYLKKTLTEEGYWKIKRAEQQLEAMLLGTGVSPIPPDRSSDPAESEPHE